MKPKFGWIWFIVSLFLSGVVAVQWNESRKQKTKLETLQIQVEKLSQQTREAQSQVQELANERRQLRSENLTVQSDLARLRSSTSATNSTTASTAPVALVQSGTPPARQKEGTRAPGQMWGDMMKDPEMRKAMAQQQRIGLNLAYGQLFKQLRLSPEQEEKFKDILMEQQISGMSQAGALMSAGPERAEIAQKLGAEQKQREQQLTELLGEEKYAQLQEYNQTLGERMMLEQLGKQVEISAEQNEDLLAIIAEEKQNAQINRGKPVNQPADLQNFIGSPEAAETMIKQQEQVNARVLERAGEILTAEQVRKLGPVLETQVEMQRAGMKMARQMFGGDAAASAAPDGPK